MTIRRREFLRTASAGLASLSMPHPAEAQSASGALLLIFESGAKNVDPHTPGAHRGCYEVAWNCYDRLLSLQIEKDENGVDHANATSRRLSSPKNGTRAGTPSRSSSAGTRPFTVVRRSRRRTSNGRWIVRSRPAAIP